MAKLSESDIMLIRVNTVIAVDMVQMASRAGSVLAFSVGVDVGVKPQVLRVFGGRDVTVAQVREMCVAIVGLIDGGNLEEVIDDSEA